MTYKQALSEFIGAVATSSKAFDQQMDKAVAAKFAEAIHIIAAQEEKQQPPKACCK